jgi:hypothetical protein
MNKWPFVLILAILSLPTALSAQEGSGLKVDEMVFCTAVQDRAPSGADTAFASVVDNVYCFVKVTGAADTTSITHVWYYQDKEVARVELPVRSSSWRTWSMKRIPPEWQGKWRVDVLSAAGDMLKSAGFIIKP